MRSSLFSIAIVLLWLASIRAVLPTSDSNKNQVVLHVNIAIDHPTQPGQQILQPFTLLANKEPVDALEIFRQRHQQTREWRQYMLIQICQQANVVCRRDVPVIFTSMIRDINGQGLGWLELREDREPADQVFEFAQKHQLPYEARRSILHSICQHQHVQCTRTNALLYQQRISSGPNDQALGVLEIYDDEGDPVDQVYRFVKDHNLPEFAFTQLREMTCANVQCLRSVPLIFSHSITTDGGRHVGMLQISLDEEPVDIVHAFGVHYGLSKAFRYQLIHHVCSDKYVRCKRNKPIVFSSPIQIENDTVIGVFKIKEDEELADAVYRFVRETNITDDLRISLLQTLCGREGIICTRGQALLKAMPIGKPDGQVLGTLEVYEGQEPADVVYQFAEQHGLLPHDRTHILNLLCGTDPEQVSNQKQKPPKDDENEEEEIPLVCNRFAPVVFAIPISAQNGSTLGVLEVLADEEPADAIARFGNKHGLEKEQKLHILKAICEASGLPCTRTEGLIYHTVYTLPDGQRERLDFYDGQEPTDVIYNYGQLRNLTHRERKDLLVKVCNEPRRQPNCTRAEPMLLSIPVWETADKKMGDLEILEGQEPVDMVYAFLEKHDLFQTEPLNTTLLEVVCNSTRVECKRMRPRRILFSMQATYAGIQHTLQYVRPESDWRCEQHLGGGQKCIHYVEELSQMFCATHMYDWNECEAQILSALRRQLEVYETQMWRGKDLYAKLGLVKSATKEEINVAYNTLVKRFNNETEPQKYEKLRDAYRVLSDPEEKHYYDLPCMKFFGLCGKRQKDGGISISAD